MIQIMQFDGRLKDEPRGRRVDGTPFAVVPVETETGRELWGMIHIPCAMNVGKLSPGWNDHRSASVDIATWFAALDVALRTALEGTDIESMREAGAVPAFDRLIEESEFTWIE